MSEAKRLAKMAAARGRYEAVLRLHPRLDQIEQRLIALHTDRVLRRGSSALIEAELSQLMQQREEYLREHGIPERFAEPDWDCPLCKDTGVVDGRPCRCQQQRLLANRFQGARLPERLREQTFQQFSLDWYAADKLTPLGISERQNAQEALATCQAFVARVMEDARQAPSLFISGKTGLGKTFLCSAICHALSENGIVSLYATYSDLITSVKAGFDSPSSGGDLLTLAREVPVLILDDLGAEYVTEFSTRCLFDIVNHRRNQRLPLVISSNLSLADVAIRYDDRIASRLLEVCLPVLLYGSDIRGKILQRKRGLA
ncbi:MAG: ATP-binding protein [Bacillota bacterium]|jgi:DNA replication protein DnaC